MSALIFVALAVAWAAYLIPKALRHHTEADESRSVETFSTRMRVLAHREPISRKATRLVVASEVRDSDGTPIAEELRARRLATRRATQRRRRVLSLILVALVVVGGLAVNGTIEPWYAAIPGGLLVAWLIACRMMVKSEHRALASSGRACREHSGRTPKPTADGRGDRDDPARWCGRHSERRSEALGSGARHPPDVRH